MALPVFVCCCVVQTAIVVGHFVRGGSSSTLELYSVAYVKEEGNKLNTIS